MNDAILSLEKNAMERWRKGDPMGWAEISAEDVMYVEPGLAGPVIGLEEYKAYLKRLEGAVSYQGSEFIDPAVVVSGDAAVLSYNYRSTARAAGGSPEKQTLWNTTEVYFRRNGAWNIVHSHWSYTIHRLPARVEVPLPVALSRVEYEGIQGEIMKAEKGAMERWRKGDPWGFLEISAPEVTYFDTGTPKRLDGLDALREEYARREGKIFYDVMEFIDPRFRVCGDMAVLFYRFFSTRLHPDGSILDRTPWNCTEVYMRKGGRWLIVHSHWSFIRGEIAGRE